MCHTNGFSVQKETIIIDKTSHYIEGICGHNSCISSLMLVLEYNHVLCHLYNFHVTANNLFKRWSD